MKHPSKILYNFTEFFDQGKTGRCWIYSRCAILSYFLDDRIHPDFFLNKVKTEHTSFSRIFKEGFIWKKNKYTVTNRGYSKGSGIALLRNSPIICSVKLYDEVNLNTKKAYLKDKNFTGWNKLGKIKGTHNMALVGYDLYKEVFYYVNSWGKNMIQEIPFELFNNICLKLFTVKLKQI